MKQQGKPSSRREPAAGRGPAIVQCPMHGIAYDTDKEACPECAKAKPKAPSVALKGAGGEAGAGSRRPVLPPPGTDARTRRRRPS
jgi:hypothetical protein